MSQTVPAKIVLKSTTKMSLNDRFTTISKMRPPPLNPQEVRAQMAATQQSSQQNRRLAQQMANRPSVQAALNRPQKSLKQRLGPSNVKARLNLNAVRGGAGGGGGVMMSNRGQRGSGRVFRRPMGRGRGNRGGGAMQNSMSDLNISPRGRGGRGGFRGRGGYRAGNSRWMDSDRRPSRGRGGGGRGYDRNRPDHRSDVQRGGRNFSGDGIRGGRGRGRGGRFQRGRGGRGRGGRGGASGVSKDELDNQLEEYMSKTKSHLNSELDAYMAEADQF